ncbi:MAG: hypothetical protein CFE29_22815 [Bradyrhizobiaceae bacterium PARB1]|nr:MAG: hypothetical protein CFE29_22815 [Bradyrhizobiaceae bacterium PARB1]
MKSIFCALCLAFTANGGLSSAVSGQEAQALSVGRHDPVDFDLPSQSLEKAIEAYSVASGWQVIYDAKLAAGLQSTTVKGPMLPAAALRRLVTGTGLIAEFMATDGAMLVVDPAVQNAPPLEPTQRIRSYYGRVQTGLKRAFCADERIREGGYRMAIGFWIDSSGQVVRVEPLSSTGEPGMDAAFVQMVRRLPVGEAPPPGFEQPIVTLITQDLLAQCSSSSVQPASVAR